MPADQNPHVRSTLAPTPTLRSSAFIHCASDSNGEVHAVGAALTGSADKAVVLQEMLDHCVTMFITVLEPHSVLMRAELEKVCIGLVGAGEALAGTVVRGRMSEADAVEVFYPLIKAAMLRRLACSCGISWDSGSAFIRTSSPARSPSSRPRRR